MRDRYEMLRDLRSEWSDCKRCPLHRGRKNIVFGDGNPYAKVMLIAEAPGRQEDEEGWPMVGPSGDMLAAMAEYCGVDIGDESHPPKDVFITNLVMCRPPDNRDPYDSEIEACRSRLDRQIQIVDPLLVVAMGRVAARTLTGHSLTITRDRGTIYDCTYRGELGGEVVIPTLVMLHPANLMRNPDMNEGGALKESLADFGLAFRIVRELENLWEWNSNGSDQGQS